MAQPIKLTVLGAGPGGYAAAFYAADLGMQVTLVDEEKNPGGVCLYRGCIPSKALLHVAKVVDEARHASKWGVAFGEPAIDVDKLQGLQELGRREADRRHRHHREDAEGDLRAGSRDADGSEVAHGGRRLGKHRRRVRLPDSRHRLAPDEDSDAVARLATDAGLHLRPRSARRAEVAPGHRRRLHRPGAGERVRDAGQQGVGGGDDAGTAAGRRSRPGGRAREEAEGDVRGHHGQHQGGQGRERKRTASA